MEKKMAQMFDEWYEPRENELMDMEPEDGVMTLEPSDGGW